MTASSLTAALLLAGNEGCLSVVHRLSILLYETIWCNSVNLSNRRDLKVPETQWFLTLEHSNRTICSLLNWNVLKWFHLFTQPPIINHFLLPQREGGRKEQGQNIGKGIHPKLNETQGFQYLRHLNCTNQSLYSWFWSKKFPTFDFHTGECQFLITPETEKEKMGFTKYWIRHRGFSAQGIQTGRIGAC